jgi:hypothetical protein
MNTFEVYKAMYGFETCCIAALLLGIGIGWLCCHQHESERRGRYLVLKRDERGRFLKA